MKAYPRPSKISHFSMLEIKIFTREPNCIDLQTPLTGVCCV